MYVHNITDAMDNQIITHFMQLNAEWSFYGSLIIFRQELVILTDLKYLCLYKLGFPYVVTYCRVKSAQKIFMFLLLATSEGAG